MPVERAPANPVSSSYVPEGGRPYQIKDGDDWHTVARQFKVEVGDLLEFNFKTRNPDEVNWYLRQKVGCRKPTRDGKNWMFSSDARPGVIYVPRAVGRIVHSVGSMSWINPSLYHPTDLPEVDRNPPGASLQKQAFFARSGYRFANFLEGYVVVNARGEISEYGYTDLSDLYYGASFRGIMPTPYAPNRRPASLAGDRKSVVFVQTVGCKTVSPETIGAREGVKTVNSLLGIHPNFGGPLGVQAQSLGAKAGWKGGENVRVFPPIWTELRLTIHADGTSDGQLVGHSLFPSVTFYQQSYGRESLGTTDASTYRQVKVYDGNPHMNRWRSSGWGLSKSTGGPSSGNPWSVADPRIIPGHDIPQFLTPGIPKE